MTLLALLGVLSSAIFSGTSLLYATLGEIVDERSGIVNLGLEGVLLVGAATGIAVTSLTGNPYLGVLVAVLAGGLMNLILAYLVVTRKANQLASGLALMFLGIGLSALIGKTFVGARINGLPRFSLPGLSPLPQVYSSLFKFDLLIYPGHSRWRYWSGGFSSAPAGDYPCARSEKTRIPPTHRVGILFWSATRRYLSVGCWQAWAQRIFP